MILDLTSSGRFVKVVSILLTDGLAERQGVTGSAKAARTLREDRLSPREVAVLKLVAEGQSTKEIAYTLGISVKTAACHRSRLMDKLKIKSTALLTRYAIRSGLIEP